MGHVIDQYISRDVAIYNADCIELMKMIPDESVGYSIFSPPYSSLYTFSNSDRDLSNCKSNEEFFEHFGFVIDSLMRIMQEGRNVSVDCMNLSATKGRDGYIGIRDFRGDLIRAFTAKGFIFHSEHIMWKDPLIEATRTKALGLLHKQLCKDSCMSRAGQPQYLLTFRKPGENKSPVAHENGLTYFIGDNEPTEADLKVIDTDDESDQIELSEASIATKLSHMRWRRYASPVWMDIRFTRTLNYRGGRDDPDERHICPMALDIIERGLELWSNPGDVVFDPFTGIGSTADCCDRMGRKFIGSELKPSYFRMAVNNITTSQRSLF